MLHSSVIEWMLVEKNETEIKEDEPTPEVKPENKTRGFWRDMLETILMAVVLFLLLNAVTSRVRVYNVSMQPTLHEGNLLVVKTSWPTNLVNPNAEISSSSLPGTVTEDKRDWSAPVEILIDIGGGVVRVNGQAITEPYIELPRYTAGGKF